MFNKLAGSVHVKDIKSLIYKKIIHTDKKIIIIVNR